MIFGEIHLSRPCTVDSALTSPFERGAEHKNPVVRLRKVKFSNPEFSDGIKLQVDFLHHLWAGEE